MLLYTGITFHGGHRGHGPCPFEVWPWCPQISINGILNHVLALVPLGTFLNGLNAPQIKKQQNLRPDCIYLVLSGPGSIQRMTMMFNPNVKFSKLQWNFVQAKCQCSHQAKLCISPMQANECCHTHWLFLNLDTNIAKLLLRTAILESCTCIIWLIISRSLQDAYVHLNFMRNSIPNLMGAQYALGSLIWLRIISSDYSRIDKKLKQSWEHNEWPSLTWTRP